MMFDQMPPEPVHRTYSTQFSHSHYKPTPEAAIQPWTSEQKPQFRVFSRKETRANANQTKQKHRKKSVDERIEEMYRKYSREGINIGQYMNTLPLNSRQMYREKLHWLEKGQQFRKIGKLRQPEQNWEKKINEEQNYQKQKQKHVSQFYYLDQKQQKQPKIQKSSPPKKALEYKCNQNFQRVLKLKQKLRKKHTLSVNKQKKQFEQQYSCSHTLTSRQSSDAPAKATLERNKLKLKMRGVSRDRLNHFDQQCNKMEIRGTCSNAFEFASQREDFNLTAFNWCSQQSNRPSLSTFLNRGFRQASR